MPQEVPDPAKEVMEQNRDWTDVQCNIVCQICTFKTLIKALCLSQWYTNHGLDRPGNSNMT
jgi:hypothetical protein